MYIYKYIFIYTRAHTLTHARTHAHTFTYTYIDHQLPHVLAHPEAKDCGEAGCGGTLGGAHDQVHVDGGGGFARRIHLW